MNDQRQRVLVAGATGYIGRRLVAELVAGGQPVRCLARTPNKLDAEAWRLQVEVDRFIFRPLAVRITERAVCADVQAKPVGRVS